MIITLNNGYNHVKQLQISLTIIHLLLLKIISILSIKDYLISKRALTPKKQLIKNIQNSFLQVKLLEILILYLCNNPQQMLNNMSNNMSNNMFNKMINKMINKMLNKMFNKMLLLHRQRRKLTIKMIIFTLSRHSYQIILTNKKLLIINIINKFKNSIKPLMNNNSVLIKNQKLMISKHLKVNYQFKIKISNYFNKLSKVCNLTKNKKISPNRTIQRINPLKRKLLELIQKKIDDDFISSHRSLQ